MDAAISASSARPRRSTCACAWVWSIPAATSRWTQVSLSRARCVFVAAPTCEEDPAAVERHGAAGSRPRVVTGGRCFPAALRFYDVSIEDSHRIPVGTRFMTWSCSRVRWLFSCGSRSIWLPRLRKPTLRREAARPPLSSMGPLAGRQASPVLAKCVFLIALKGERLALAISGTPIHRLQSGGRVIRDPGSGRARALLRSRRQSRRSRE